MKLATDQLAEIYNFKFLDDQFGTSGQPTPDQFQKIRDAGFEAVINLAMPTSDNALPNEGGLVTGLGMSYVHLPINFAAPMPRDFNAFCQVMKAFADRPVYVHCAMNMRVSAFMFLYRVVVQHRDPQTLVNDVRAIWEPDEVWTQFIQEQLKTAGLGPFNPDARL